MDEHSPIGLTCTDLVVRFRRIRALDGLNLAVSAGESVGLVGRNGAGKSTLLRAVMGMVVPRAGTVATSPALPRLDLLARTGYVPDTLSAWDWMTVGQVISLVRDLQPHFDGAWCDELAEELRLDRAAGVKSISRGNQARLAFLLAVSHRPGLLLLDEPLLGTDPVSRDVILGAIVRLRAESGCTVLLASHQISDIARLVDRVVIIDRGRVVEDQPTERLAMSSKRVVLRPAPSSVWKAPQGTFVLKRDAECVVLAVRADSEGVVQRLSCDPESERSRIAVLDVSLQDACSDRLRELEAA